MTRLAAILAFCAAPALAQDHPLTARNGNDTVSIEAFGTSEALVIYSNHESKASGSGTTTVSVVVEGVEIVVDVNIKVNMGDLGEHELATVTPRNGYVAIPDHLSVADGSEGRFRILRPMF
jgi:hypothetical protein